MVENQVCDIIRKDKAEEFIAERILGEIITNDFSKEGYDKYSTTDLFWDSNKECSKVSWEAWKNYFNKNKERTISLLKESKEYKDIDGEIKPIGNQAMEEITPKDKEIKKIFGIQGQVEQLYEVQPFFYNRSSMFYVWDNELKKYNISDEIDLLNGIAEIGADTINSKAKTEILNAVKQFGRKKIPKDAPMSWIQFKDIIYDWKTGERFNATPEYFMTSPMPFSPGESEDTPTIDALFLSWVGEDYKKTLEEIAAYSCCSNQFMQRMIALVGGGANGKGTYTDFLIRLLGKDNTCSSELKELCSNQFETAMIYKKQLCLMGEVSGGDMSNTNQIKKLAGSDPIRFCFKGKTPFTDDSITTLINCTNELPRSPDKTIGFYRRWLIVDFPNQFPIKEGILDSIPEKEMENFCKKILRILSELGKSQKFTNEGSFQERMDRYEQRSNPVVRYIETQCEEEPGNNLVLKDFADAYNKYAKENHIGKKSVIQIGKLLREEGFDMGSRKFDLGDGNKTNKVAILNLKLKTIETIETIEISTDTLRKESSSNSNGSNGSNGSSINKPSKGNPFCPICNSPTSKTDKGFLCIDPDCGGIIND